MKYIMLSKQSKQNAIIKYLSKNDFDGDICVKELKEKDVNEIYDLYTEKLKSDFC